MLKKFPSGKINGLIFKLQQQVLNSVILNDIKFNDICVSWGSPKTDLEKTFLYLEN